MGTYILAYAFNCLGQVMKHWFKFYVTQLDLAYGPQGLGLRVTQNAYFLLLTHTKQLLTLKSQRVPYFTSYSVNLPKFS